MNLTSVFKTLDDRAFIGVTGQYLEKNAGKIYLKVGDTILEDVTTISTAKGFELPASLDVGVY